MRKRIFISIFACALVCILSLGLATTLNLSNEVRGQNRQKLETYVSQCAVVCSFSTIEDYDVLARQIARNLQSSFPGLYVTFYGRDGTVLGTSGVPQSVSTSVNREIFDAFEDGSGFQTRMDEADAVRAYATARVNEHIVVSMSIENNQLGTQRSNNWLFYNLFYLILLVVAYVMSRVVAGFVANPLDNIINEAAIIAAGRINGRITIRTNRDLTTLSDSLNRIADKLQRSIDDLIQQYSMLESIMATMIDGVIAVDKQKHIIMINDVARRLFDVTEPTLGVNVNLVIQCKPMDDFLTASMVRGGMRSEELIIGERIVELTVAPVVLNEHPITSTRVEMPYHSTSKDAVGALAIFQDITELRKLEQMRSEFVANVSHELRTPLTSIKGFVETLQQGAIKDEKLAMRFFHIIENEADRLDRLIGDILTLSRIERMNEDESRRPVMKRTDFDMIIMETVEILQNQAKAKSITLHYIGQDEVYVLGIADELKQLAVNLIENAIKYTPNGGSVTVHLTVDSGRAIFSVADTGIGISAEHQSRLFERFYRVDKGRSRDMGGTGLGLSIVKHIATSMHGHVSVTSELDKGSTFTVVIPVIMPNDNRHA